jgi:hypothetical protein
MPTLRIKPTRLQRLLAGLSLAGRYGSPVLVAAALGCTPQLRQVAVSDDGRYVVAPVAEDGRFMPIDANNSTAMRMVVLDRKTGDVRTIAEVKELPLWTTTAGGVTVFMTSRENKSLMMVHAAGRTRQIADATMPSLSRDGKKVIYTRAGDDPFVPGTLMVYDVEKDKSEALNLSGVFAEISPDGKRVLLANQDASGADPGWVLAVAPLDGTDKPRTLAKIDPETRKLFCPRWVDNESVVYRTRTTDSPNDGELFITDLTGQTQQITSNDVEDVNPQVVSAGTVVYAQVPTDSTREISSTAGDLFMAQKKDGQWQHRALGIRAHAFAVAGDKLIYATEPGGRVMEASLASPQKATDLTEVIAKGLTK